MKKYPSRGFEVVTNVHIAACCSPVGHKYNMATKDVLYDHTVYRQVCGRDS